MNNPSVDIETRLKISALEQHVKAGHITAIKAMASVLAVHPELQIVDTTDMDSLKQHPLFALTMLHADSIGWTPHGGRR